MCQIVVFEPGDRLKALDVVIPPRKIPLSGSRWERFQLVMIDLVAEAMRYGVGIGPLHRETLLDEEAAWCPIFLVPVSEEDPLRDGRVECHRIALRVWNGLGTLLILAVECLEESHDLFAMGKDEGFFGIGLITAQKTLEPVELRRPLRRVVGADVAVIERVRECILGDNVEVAPVKGRIPFGCFKTFAEDHVGWYEAPRVGSPEDKTVLREVSQHVVPVHPSEPVTSLGTCREAGDKGEDRSCPGKARDHPSTPFGFRELLLEAGVEHRSTVTGQHDEERISEALVLVLHVPSGVVIAVVP